MKDDNRGLSLVELIVVIAIMAVLIGVGVLSMRLLFGTQARGCAQNVSAMLDETKTGSMSRFDETMTLSYLAKDSDKAVKSNGYYAQNRVYTINKNAQPVAITATDDTGAVSDSEIRRMGSPKVVITVYLSDGTSFELGDSRSIRVSFDRATGACEPVAVDGTLTDDYIDKITFSSGLRTYTITMIPETGKHKLEG